MNKFYLIPLILLLGFKGCGYNGQIAQTIAAKHPEYYPELSLDEREYLIYCNLEEGYDALAYNKIPPIKINHHNYNTTNCIH